MGLEFIKSERLQQVQQEKEIRRGDKHHRAELDRVRDDARISLATLNEKLPKLIGREVHDIGQLSNGEMRFLIERIRKGKI
jgi:hypothetical protein